MTDQIRRGGYFCIEIRDAFTNQPVESNEVKIFVNGQRPLLKKEGKYYIFSKVKEDILEIEVQTSLYERKKCTISFPRSIKEICLVSDGILFPFCGTFLFSVLLYPNENYILPEGYYRKEISCNPEEEIRVIKNRDKWFFLEKEYKGGDVIEMYMSGESGIKGRYFRIEEKEGMSYEDFIIIEEKEGFCYQMKEALKGRYPKGSRIYELYHKRADEQGRVEVIVKVRD